MHKAIGSLTLLLIPQQIHQRQRAAQLRQPRLARRKRVKHQTHPIVEREQRVRLRGLLPDRREALGRVEDVVDAGGARVELEGFAGVERVGLLALAEDGAGDGRVAGGVAGEDGKGDVPGGGSGMRSER